MYKNSMCVYIRESKLYICMRVNNEYIYIYIYKELS